MIALNLIRKDPHYRRDAFDRGLAASGYTVVDHGRPTSKRDLLVIWNKYGSNESMASIWEREGGTVLVCENGYIGADSQGRQYYAISAHGHNGSGWFNEGPPGRFDKLGIDVAPWRTDGEHVVIRGQRGIGPKETASPPNWHFEASIRLKRLTKRRVVVMEHPGNHAPKPTGEEQLRGAWACVIWSSAMGVRALVMGIPVFYESPYWICEAAGRRDMAMIDQPLCDDELRRAALERMAWAQWSVEEIEMGLPFLRFLDAL